MYVSQKELLIGIKIVKVKVKVKLGCLAPNAGIAEIANRVRDATPCYDAQRCWWDLNPVRLTVLAAKSVDHNTAPQHLQ